MVRGSNYASPVNQLWRITSEGPEKEVFHIPYQMHDRRHSETCAFDRLSVVRIALSGREQTCRLSYPFTPPMVNPASRYL